MDPLIMSIASIVGSKVLSQLLDQFGGSGGSPSAAAGAIQQRLGASAAMIPQLQAQARGAVTPATEATMRRLTQEVTRYKQAYGATARRGQMAGSIPAQAVGTRLEGLRVQGIGDIMARQQAAAQQQLLGLGAGALPMQREIEKERWERGRLAQADIRSAMEDIASIFAEHKLEKERGEVDARGDEMVDALRQAFMNMLKQWGGAGG